MILLSIGRVTFGQAPGTAELTEAYKALAAKDYARAVPLFRKGLTLQASNAGAHKDLAYALLKTGENAEARDEFEAALKLNPKDETAALEFGFLAYETKKPVEARRTFDRLRHSTNPTTRATAEQAFQNIDRPLAEGIARWQDAIRKAPNPADLSFYSAHWELAQLAELREEYSLAAEQYAICRKLKPQLGELLLLEAGVLRKLNRLEEANTELLLASRSSDSRTAERALEQLGSRYPYPYEFVQALKLDPSNVLLRRELAYLYLAMHKDSDAKAQFEQVLQYAPNDRLSREQLELMNGGLKSRTPPGDAGSPTTSVTNTPNGLVIPLNNPQRKADARTMGVKSLSLGYYNDAIKYLRQAHEQDPDDAEVMLKLGYAYNMAKNDEEAIPWFDQARHSGNAFVAVEAARAYHNLRGDTLPQTTVWLLPMYSSRWQDAFTYGQIKRTLPLPWSAANRVFSFYVSTRFIGDVKSSVPNGIAAPQYLSESSVIVGGGIATKTWHHLTGWAEAGEAIKYLPFRHDIGIAIPDYRGGVNFAKGFGSLLGSNISGLFYETTADAIYVSRFDKDWLFYSQHRAGRTFRIGENSAVQLLLNANVTQDAKAQYWANTLEFGPGIKIKAPFLPPGAYFSTDFLHGVYTNNEYNPRRPNYNDIRVGFWYAFTK
jgi:Flp pilus assembly protein TadD